MKAIVYTKYGSPDVLQLKDVEEPVPLDDEVLVEVHAASVNAYDWHLMRGEPFPARMENGWRRPRSGVRGVDLAGHVEAVGRNVDEILRTLQAFQTGDLCPVGWKPGEKTLGKA